MAEGSKCTVKIDATQAIARVIFSSSSYLGIDYDAQIDQVITIPDGKTEITIYNAAESGPITFGISFSAAETTAMASAILTTAISLLSF